MSTTISEYLSTLSTNAPTPGGGGTAALIGALGSSLASMVAALTTGKKKYAAYEEDIRRILSQTAALRDRFTQLIQADADAFEPLSKAYGIPKDTPGREETLQKCLLAAMQPPLDILSACEELLPILEELSVKGSVLAISDDACAASACRDAATAASMNVFVNTRLLTDRETAHRINQETRAKLDVVKSRCDAVLAGIGGKLLTSSLEQTPTTKELRGMPVVKSMCAALAPQIEALAAKGITPKLAIVRVGANPDDLSYEKGILKRFENNGAAVAVHELAEDVTQEELEKKVLSLNADDSVHGILVFRPLPKHLDEKQIAAIIDPSKDVDCMSELNLAGVFSGRGNTLVFAPCTPQAVVELLDGYGIDCTGKRVVIVGRSVVVGKPLSMLLLNKNATVTICHTRTKDLAAECRRADILIACAGVAKMITPAYTNPDQIVIDVGINFVDGQLCGDVDYEAVYPIVAGISPVPGGVGTLTSTVILKHTIMRAALTD